MICKNCGGVIEDGSTVCSQCHGNPEGLQQMPVSDKKKKRWIVFSSIVAVVIVASISLLFLLFRNSYETPVKEAVDMFNDRSVEAEELYQLYKDGPQGKYMYEYEQFLNDMDKELSEVEAKIDEEVEAMYDDFSEKYGDDWKVSYEIRRAKELKGSSLKEVQEFWERMQDKFADMLEDYESLADLEDPGRGFTKKDMKKVVEFHQKWMDQLDDMEITEGYELKIDFTIEGEEEKEKETEEILVYKLDGEWVLEKGLYSVLRAFTF